MLSDLIVRQAKCTGKPYSLADFDGLYLYISAIGTKAWHFRFTWAGKRERMTLGGYPALSLKDARKLREEARALLARGLNPHTERKRKRQATVLAGEHTFKAVYEQWLAHRSLSLEAGRQTSLAQIERVFKKDVLPVLAHLTVYDITRAHLLNIIGKVEKRGSLSVAEKLRTWFTQLFTYATVVVPDMSENPSKDLRVVAMPLPPVENNPFLRMPQLPAMLQTLRKYRGRLNQLALSARFVAGETNRVHAVKRGHFRNEVWTLKERFPRVERYLELKNRNASFLSLRHGMIIGTRICAHGHGHRDYHQ